MRTREELLIALKGVMEEYKVTVSDGWFNSKVVYVKANSAAEIQAYLEDTLAFEISEGMRIKDISKV